MIQLSTLPTPGPIDIGRPVASPLGTTSAFTLALAELAVAGAAPVVAAPGAMVAAMPVADTVVARPVLQDPAATGSDLPVAADAPAVPTAASAAVTVAFEAVSASVAIPTAVPVAFRPVRDAAASLPVGETAPTRPILSAGNFDVPNVCPADLPAEGDAPAAPPVLNPEGLPITIAVAAPVAPVVVALSEPDEPPAPVTPAVPDAPTAGADTIPAKAAAPITVAVPSLPTKSLRTITPDGATTPRSVTRHAASQKHAAAVIVDDAAPWSDTSDEPAPKIVSEPPIAATEPSGTTPLPVPSDPQIAPAPGPVAQNDPTADLVVDTTIAKAALLPASSPVATPQVAAPPVVTTPALAQTTTVTMTDSMPVAANGAASPPTGETKPLTPPPSTDVLAAPMLHPIRDARPMPTPAPFDVRPALTPGSAPLRSRQTVVKPATPTVSEAPAVETVSQTIAAASPQPAGGATGSAPAVVQGTAAASRRTVTAPVVAEPAAAPDASRLTVSAPVAPPTAATAGATAPEAPRVNLTASAPAATPVKASTERPPAPDALRVIVTVAAPAMTPIAPSIPQPAAQAFAAAMFAFADDRREDPRGDALLSDIAASLSLNGVGTPPTPIAAGMPLPVVDTARSDWIEKMIDRIETIQGESGASETRIRLTPDALGNVDVSVTRDASGALQLRMTSDNPHARTLLAEAAPRLAEMAEARGLKLGGSGVDSGTQGQGQGERQSETPAPRQPPRPARARADAEATTTETRLA